MRHSRDTRPCWVVLAPGKRSTIRRKLGPEPEDEEDDPLEIREGDEGYTAIIEHSPGAECCGEDAIARDLTRTAEKPA